MLTQDRLKELLHYNPETGVFTWKICRNQNSKVGSVSGSISNIDGYRRMHIDTKMYKASRLAFLYMLGYFPENMVDHIDRVKDNDRWCNLRHVSRQCNARNQSISRANKSGITGVSWHKHHHKWWPQIAINQQKIHLGYYDTKIDAARSRWEAEKKYNFPNCNTTSSAYKYLKLKGEI